MANKILSAITTIDDAKEYITVVNEQYFTSQDPVEQNVSYLIYSLSHLYGTALTREGYHSRKIALSCSIESTIGRANHSKGDALTFAPSIFLLLKFDFAISDDIESSDIVRYRLLNSLAMIFELPPETVTLQSIKSQDNYLQFVQHALNLRQTIDLEAVPLDQHQQRHGSERPSYLTALLAAGPASVNYEELVTGYEEAQRVLKREFENKLVPSLRAEIESKPHDTYEKKLELVRWLNGELRRLDLAIKSPVTGRVGTLSADSNGKRGRFKIKSLDDSNQMTTINMAKLSEFLDKLELMDAPSRREPLREWREKVTRPNDGPERE